PDVQPGRTSALEMPESYNAVVSNVSTAKVSHRGQTSLPAGLRRRWGIEDGGERAVIDPGDAPPGLPGGAAAPQTAPRPALLHQGGYEAAVTSIDDPDLALQ